MLVGIFLTVWTGVDGSRKEGRAVFVRAECKRQFRLVVQVQRHDQPILRALTVLGQKLYIVNRPDRYTQIYVSPY
jgi:hypothetical protein